MREVDRTTVARAVVLAADAGLRRTVETWLQQAGYAVDDLGGDGGAGPQVVFVHGEVSLPPPAAAEATLVRLVDAPAEPEELDDWYEVLEPPLTRARVLASARRATERAELCRFAPPAESAARPEAPGALVARSPVMQSVLRQVERAAKADGPVGLLGEGGTGKELLARIIHRRSRRAARPFVVVNCAALPQESHEPELFGVELAPSRFEPPRPGRLAQARRGTLFLDEVDSLSPIAQAGLHQMMSARGEAEESAPRIIAASRVDLRSEVRAGRFREDLHLRLSTHTIHAPPLRSRPEDIPELVLRLLEGQAEVTGRAVERVAQGAVEALVDYDWPGNVRELENAVRRAVLSATGDTLTVEDLPSFVTQSVDADAIEASDEVVPLAVLERRAIRHALRVAEGNVDRAARLLGMGRATLYRRLAKYDDEG